MVFATQTPNLLPPRKGRLVAANLWAEPPAAKGHTIAVIPIIQPGFGGLRGESERVSVNIFRYHILPYHGPIPWD